MKIRYFIIWFLLAVFCSTTIIRVIKTEGKVGAGTVLFIKSLLLHQRGFPFDIFCFCSTRTQFASTVPLAAYNCALELYVFQ